MPEEPVFGDAETGVFGKGLGEEGAAPEGDGAVGKGGGAEKTGELALEDGEFVFEALGSVVIYQFQCGIGK